MKTIKALIPFGFIVVGAVIGATIATHSSSQKSPMKLGAFSLSLSVKDLSASRAFYEKLGFHVVMGEAEQHWLILRNGETTLGLFQGMFPRNTLTFNPGWDGRNQPLEQFDDIREIQRRLKAQGVRLDSEADENGRGPASAVLTDPDGNPILLDQHV